MTSPAWASSPAGRTLSPAWAGAVKATRPPARPSPDTTPTTSYFTTASASAGSGAPVMMRTHCPSPMVPSNHPPAGTSAMTSSSTGASSEAPASCEARIAKPSMAEWAKGDTSISLARSSAATRPIRSSRDTISGCNGLTRDSTSSRASSRDIISGTAMDSPSERKMHPENPGCIPF